MAEEIQVPEWLDVDFLHTCLHNDERYRGVVIVKYSTSSAVPPGYNFASNIYRVNIEYKNGEKNTKIHSLSIIVKIPLMYKSIEDLIQDNIESNFYDKFLPQARKLLEDSFAPKRFNHPYKSVIVMEDLKAQGFLMADKSKMLDFEHCELYMRAVAKFHAVSHAVCKQSPEIIEIVNRDNEKTETGDLIRKVSYYAVQCMAAHIDSMDKCKDYGPLLKNCSNTIWDDVNHINKQKGDFNCFTQGDPCIPNMMFKYDHNKKPIDVKIVDFQAVTYSPPLQNVIFSICNCASYDVQKTRIDDLFHIYLNELNSNLQKLHCSYQFSYEQFKEEEYKCTPQRILLFALSHPTLPVKNLDAQKIFGKAKENVPLSENPYEEFYNENYCVTVLPQILELMEKQGVFAYLADKQV